MGQKFPWREGSLLLHAHLWVWQAYVAVAGARGAEEEEDGGTPRREEGGPQGQGVGRKSRFQVGRCRPLGSGESGGGRLGDFQGGEPLAKFCVGPGPLPSGSSPPFLGAQGPWASSAITLTSGYHIIACFLSPSRLGLPCVHTITEKEQRGFSRSWRGRGSEWGWMDEEAE